MRKPKIDYFEQFLRPSITTEMRADITNNVPIDIEYYAKRACKFCGDKRVSNKHREMVKGHAWFLQLMVDTANEEVK